MPTTRGAGVVLILGLAACGSPEASDERLLVRARAGVAVVEPGGETTSLWRSASPSRTWDAVVRTRMSGDATEIVAVDPESGDELWRRREPGKLVVKAVSHSGDLVALSPAGERHFSSGRGKTALVLAGATAPTRKLVLDGNIEPEAFSTDGETLFLLSYLPARRPNSYQVRQLDLQQPRVAAVYTPDEELQERMRGTARLQTISPDGEFLYTLYTLYGGRHGFVHVLNLTEKWAHCIDLPAPFGTSEDRAVAMTVSPDGDRLYIADGDAQSIASVDTRALKVDETEYIFLGWKGRMHAQHGPDGSLYLARGASIVALDADSLTERSSWSTGDTIRGLQIAQDGSRLYAGTKHMIEMIDLDSGQRLGRFEPDGLGKIRGFGPAQPLSEGLASFECAC